MVASMASYSNVWIDGVLPGVVLAALGGSAWFFRQWAKGLGDKVGEVDRKVEAVDAKVEAVDTKLNSTNEKVALIQGQLTNGGSSAPSRFRLF